MKKRGNAVFLTRGAVISAIYVILTYLSYIFGLSSGVFQIRLSEMLCILPIFFPEAVPGLAVGCLLANLLTGAAIWDTIFGSLATLMGAAGARLIAKTSKKLYPLTPLPTVAANTLILPFVLRYTYGIDEALPFLFLGVGLGELFAAWMLGLLFLGSLKKVFKQ